jgi:hypothetical protein
MIFADVYKKYLKAFLSTEVMKYNQTREKKYKQSEYKSYCPNPCCDNETESIGLCEKCLGQEDCCAKKNSEQEDI